MLVSGEVLVCVEVLVSSEILVCGEVLVICEVLVSGEEHREFPFIPVGKLRDSLYKCVVMSASPTGGQSILILERVWIIVTICNPLVPPMKSVHSDTTLCKRINIIITGYNNSSLK